MSKTIDERVVSMQFDNKNFEKNTAQTMSTLDKLKEKLKFSNGTKGLENLGSAAKKVDMSGLSRSVDTVHAKFTALDVVAMTTLSNITNQAINTGQRMISALTLDPITSGFREYETQMGAVQTILANTQSKGSTLEDVNAALDELNKYADKTIYNFTEMTRNIGTFTAAGVDLEKSVTSIKGIANLAAVSGSTSQQASVAMYQLSQALATGRVSLMDWNSVVNAGMGGELFQNALKRTATQMGHNVDELIAKYGSFRESLTEGEWLTAEVLTETLTQLSGAYTEADLIAQGYTEQQAKDIVKLADTAVAAATEVKTFTQLWDTMKEAAGSGWAQTWKTIIGDFEEAKDLLTGISEFFTGDNGIITVMSNRRNDMLSGALDSNWEKLTAEIEKAGVPLKTFNDEIKNTAKTHKINIDSLINEYGSLKKVMESGKISGDLVTETLDRISGSTDGLNKSTTAMNDKLEYFQKVVKEVWHGDYKNGKERVEALTKAGYDYAAVQDLVNKTVDGHKLTLDDLGEKQLKAIGYTEEQVKAIQKLAKEAKTSGSSINELIENMSAKSGRVLFWESLANLAQPLITIFRAVGEAWNDAFPPNGGKMLYSFIKAFHGFTEALKINERDAENLTRTLKGLFAVLDLISMIVGGGLKIGFTIFSEVLKTVWSLLGFGNATILEITATIGDAIVAFRDWIEEHNLIADAVGFVVPLLFDFGKAIWNLIQTAWELPVVQGTVKKFTDTFVFLGEFLSKTFGPAIEIVKEFIDTLANMKDVSLENISKAFDKFSDKISKVFEGKNFVEIGRHIIDGLAKGLGEGIDVVITAIKNIGQVLIDGFCELLGIHSPSVVAYGWGQNIIEGLVNGIVAGLKFVVDVIKNIGSSIVEAFEKFSLEDVLNILKEFGAKLKQTVLTLVPVAIVIYLVKQIGDFISVFTDGIRGINNVIDGFGDALEGLGGMFKGLGAKFKADAFKSIATALAILVGSVIALTFVDPDKLYGAIAVMIVLGAGLTALSWAVSKVADSEVSFGKLAVMMAGMSIALATMASVIKKLGTLKPEQYTQGIQGLASMVIAIGALLLVFSQLDWKQARSIDKFGKMILKLSVALLLMAAVTKIISGLSLGDLGKGALFAAGFGAFVFAMTAIGKYAGNRAFDQIGKMMLKISTAMLLMIGVINLVDTISAEEALKGAAFAAAFVVFVKFLVKVTKVDKNQEIAKLGGMLMGIAGAMAIMSLVVKLLGGMSVGEIVKGSAGILALTGVIYLLIEIVKKVGNEGPKIALTLLSMSTAIGILAGISVLMGLIKTQYLVKGIAAVGALSVFMSLMIVATRGAKDVRKNLMWMSVAIALMAGSIAMLAFIDPVGVGVAAAAMSSVMGMFALIAKTTGGMKSVTKELIVMTAAIGILAGIIALLAQLPVENVMGSAMGLSALLLSLSASMAILSKVKMISPTALAAAGVMTLIIGALAGILYLMQGMDPASTMANVKGLSALLLEMTFVLGALTLIGMTGPSAFIGMGALATLIAGLGALMLGIGALFNNISGLEGSLDKGIEILGKIGEGLGMFFGKIIAGFAEGVMSALPSIGQSLSQFMINLTPFIVGAKSLDASSMEGVKALTGAILMLTAAEVLDGLTSWLTGGTDLAEFGAQLIPFGRAMVEFSGIVSGNIDNEAVTSAANAGKIMAAMNSSLPKSGGVFQFFTGETMSMTEFGMHLRTFGKAITDFSKTLIANGGVNTEAVTAASNAGKIMAEMANSLPKDGGVFQFFTGSTMTMSEFGTELISFGSAITGFSKSLVAAGGVDESAVKSAGAAGTIMAELANKLPKNGGVFGFFSGETMTMSEFGAELLAFGSAITGFSTEVAGKIKEEAVIAAANAGLIMIKLSEALDGLDTGWFDDMPSLEDFGADLAAFGTKLSQYYDNISGINAEMLTTTTSSVKKLADIIIGMDGLEGNGAASFVEAINTLATANVSGFMNAFNVESSGIQNVISNFVDSFANGLTAKAKGLATTMNEIINTIISTMKSRDQNFTDAGVNAMNKIISGIESRKTNTINSMKTVLKSTVSAIKGYYGDFKEAGKHLVTGFASGISANTYLAAARSKEMARAAKEAAKKELDEHSPSKEGYQIGDYFGGAFVTAIADNVKPAFNASKDMAKSAKSGLTNAIRKISDVINSDLDTQPTIRPVLDLSAVAAGAGEINGLFGMRPSVSALTNASAINSMVNRRVQNGSSDDVVSAINDLKRAIKDSSGDSYNINGITYDDGSNVSDTVKALIRAAKIERRV